MTIDVDNSQPKPWKYLAGASISLIVVLALWIVFVMLAIEPDSLMTQEQPMSKRFLWWIVPPLLLVSIIFGTRWHSVSQEAQARAQHVQELDRARKVAASLQEKREYVLEIIGMGVTLDKYRQEKLWEALQAGNASVTIREQDAEKYPWSGTDKSGLEGSRYGDTLENGAQYTPMYFAVPVFNAMAPIHNESYADKPNEPRIGLAGGAVVSGMAWHLFVVGPRRFEERPDRIVEDIFAFFDANPDVPYIVLNSHDGAGTRDENRPVGAPQLLRDGYYIPEMPDASALFVLARRERVDQVRPFVWDDPKNDFLQTQFRWMYYELAKAVPHPDRAAGIRTPSQVGATRTDSGGGDGVQREPLISEWLEASATFVNRAEVRGTGLPYMLDDFNPWANRPPRAWKPTPWFPLPWNRDQLATFDRLPTLGFLHRPSFIQFKDQDGKPLTRRDDRLKALLAGWQEALLNLPEAERVKAPARVVVATGGNTDQGIAIERMLSTYAAQGGPELDSGKSSQFIDTDRRLGNTGAATLFVQMAIGVMGSYRDGGISAAINLREPDEASIVFISPPSEERRKTQMHGQGGNVFAHRVTPAIDPANYGNP